MQSVINLAYGIHTIKILLCLCYAVSTQLPDDCQCYVASTQPAAFAVRVVWHPHNQQASLYVLCGTDLVGGLQAVQVDALTW